MSYTTDGFVYIKGLDGGTITDDVVPAGSTQAGANPSGLNEVIRVTQGSSNQGIILPSVNYLDNSGIIYVVNDGPNTIKVYPAAGEQINALGANAAVSLATGTVGIFMPLKPATLAAHPRHGAASGAQWASATLPAITT